MKNVIFNPCNKKDVYFAINISDLTKEEQKYWWETIAAHAKTTLCSYDKNCLIFYNDNTDSISILLLKRETQVEKAALHFLENMLRSKYVRYIEQNTLATEIVLRLNEKMDKMDGIMQEVTIDDFKLFTYTLPNALGDTEDYLKNLAM